LPDKWKLRNYNLPFDTTVSVKKFLDK